MFVLLIKWFAIVLWCVCVVWCLGFCCWGSAEVGSGVLVAVVMVLLSVASGWLCILLRCVCWGVVLVEMSIWMFGIDWFWWRGSCVLLFVGGFTCGLFLGFLGASLLAGWFT